MAQDLTVNIKTTSEVPQAMEKAKSATVSFSKQLDDIRKKFSTAFKDIALGFIAPMVLLNAAINFIGAAIEKRKQDIKDAYDFAIKAESKYLDAETVLLARQRSGREQEQKEKEMSKTARITEFTKFLEQPGMRDEVADQLPFFRRMRLKAGLDANSAEDMAKSLDVQEVIKRMLAPAVALSQKAQSKEIESAKKTADFKGPEGFGNVIGVGANPVLEAMAIQNEELIKQTALLQTLVDRNPFGSADFTKSSSPSRAAMLMGN
jgi:hypothetical protein